MTVRGTAGPVDPLGADHPVTRRTPHVTLFGVNPDEEYRDWITPGDPYAAPPTPASPTPWQPYPPVPVSGPIVPPPPPQHITYVQPVARRGLTGPHAAVWITVLVLGVLVVMPTLCCLGMALIGAAGQGSR